MTRSGDLLDHGTFSIHTTTWMVGDYTVLLESTNGMLMRRAAFSLFAPSTPAQVLTNCADCTPDTKPISISWMAAPGNRWDSIGIWSVTANTTRLWRCEIHSLSGFVFFIF